MNLVDIREGDIVLVDDGHAFHAIVTGKPKGARHLHVTPLCSRHRPGPVPATQIKGHWRRSKKTSRTASRGAPEHARVLAALYPTTGRGVQAAPAAAPR